MQVMFGLYATSIVRATLDDAASRAATGGGAGAASWPAWRRRPRQSLGADRPPAVDRDRARGVDEDGDGAGDVVVGRARAVPPRFVPPSIGGMIGFEEISAGARVRIERVR